MRMYKKTTINEKMMLYTAPDLISSAMVGPTTREPTRPMASSVSSVKKDSSGNSSAKKSATPEYSLD